MTLQDEPIPFLDLITPHHELEEPLTRVFRDALTRAAFVGGPAVTQFETAFASYCGASHCAGVASGTDALRFAYLAAGVRPGDEVITVPNTFIATTEALTQAGAVIRFVDVDPSTLNMDAQALRAAITKRTVGVVPVHLYGQPANLGAILPIAERSGIWVVEDAAQAHGAKYRGRPAGSFGVAGCFSFYPGKNLGACGEAGAVVTQDRDVLERVLTLRDHGQARKYYHDTEGYNGRLDAVQAAILSVKLELLDRWNAQRRELAAHYRECLTGLPDVRAVSEEPEAEGVYHLFVVEAERRDDLRVSLEREGIHTGLHYPLPLHLQRAYASRGEGKGAYPVAERSAERVLSLPMFPNLTRTQVERVAEAVRRFYGS